MNALRCDRCGNYFPVKTRLTLTIRTVRVPNGLDAVPLWNHDLCPKCVDELRDWWVAGRGMRQFRGITGQMDIRP